MKEPKASPDLNLAPANSGRHLTPESRAKVILQSILAAGRPATQHAYTADLADFTRFVSKDDPAAAVAILIGGSFDQADLLIRRYRDEMVQEKKRDLSAATVNRRLTVLRKMVRAAHRRGWTTWLLDVPNVKDEAVKNPDGPSATKAGEMLAKAAADNSPAGRRTYAILRLALDLGLRRGAICALDVADVDLASRKVRVLLKGREKKRMKDLAPPTCVAIRRWVDVHPLRPLPKSAPLFVNLIPGRNTRLSGPAVYNIVTAISVAVGARTRPHGLRHTAITEAVQRASSLGETLDQVQAFSDHKDFRMVLRYRNAGRGVQKKFTEANAAAFGDPFAKP